jgi:hypothetical protein
MLRKQRDMPDSIRASADFIEARRARGAAPPPQLVGQREVGRCVTLAPRNFAQNLHQHADRKWHLGMKNQGSQSNVDGSVIDMRYARL